MDLLIFTLIAIIVLWVGIALLAAVLDFLGWFINAALNLVIILAPIALIAFTIGSLALMIA